MDRFSTLRRKRNAVNLAEASGQVADSLDVRIALINRVKNGEITFEQMQKELAAIKRNAKKHGQITRAQAYSRG